MGRGGVQARRLGGKEATKLPEFPQGRPNPLPFLRPKYPLGTPITSPYVQRGALKTLWLRPKGSGNGGGTSSVPMFCPACMGMGSLEALPLWAA